MNQLVNWGIIGTGAIAQTFARAVSNSRTGSLFAVASRSQRSADNFARAHSIPHAHGSYQTLLDHADVQAVYVSTPHPFHAEWATKALNAGKHVLCEKPMGMNQRQVTQIIDAAQHNKRFLMEAFMYRCHPQTQKLVELLNDRTIGDVRVIQATFSYHATFDPALRHFNIALGGGGILDVGCYPVSIVRLIAGAAIGKAFADPIQVKGVGHLGQTRTDEWTVAVAQFPGDIVAQLSTGQRVNQENVVRIFGSEGQITLPNPWVMDRHKPDPGTILVHRTNEPIHEIAIPATVTSFTYEADLAGDAIRAGQSQAKAPAMSWDDSLGNIRAMDAWRASIGLKYPADD